MDDSLVLGLAPAECNNDIALWAGRHGFELGSFAGPLPSSDNTWRLLRKIDEKAKQLPLGSPNALVIPAQDLFLFAGDPLYLLAQATEVVARQEKLALLVLTSESGDTVSSAVERIGDHLLVTSDRGGIGHRSLVVRNTNCATTLPKGTLNKVLLAFSL